MKRFKGILAALAVSILSISSVSAQSQRHDAERGLTSRTSTTQSVTNTSDRKEIKKILFIGDSMTGWLAERLNAYGKANGFDVATVVWDGSTIRKWAESPRLKTLIAEQKPDAVFVSLGMNELFEANPDKKLTGSVEKIKQAIGSTPLVWVGPPSWPGHKQGETLNKWLSDNLGDKQFFRSFDLTLPRQSAKNPHPSRAGIIKWMDQVVDWIDTNDIIPLNLDKRPSAQEMSRGKTFIYKRMSETL